VVVRGAPGGGYIRICIAHSMLWLSKAMTHSPPLAPTDNTHAALLETVLLLIDSALAPMWILTVHDLSSAMTTELPSRPSAAYAWAFV